MFFGGRSVLWRQKSSLELVPCRVTCGTVLGKAARPCVSPTGDRVDLCRVGVRLSSREIFAKC